MVHKACPCIFRSKNGKSEMLVFKHPHAGHQMIKGSVELHESIEHAVLRELEEESGIANGKVIRHLSSIDFIRKREFQGHERSELNKWHLYEVHVDELLPDSWEHKAYGSKAENGLIFGLFWQQLNVEYIGYNKRYTTCFEQISKIC